MVDRLHTLSSERMIDIPLDTNFVGIKFQINDRDTQLDVIPFIKDHWPQMQGSVVWGVTWNDQYRKDLNHRIRGYVATNFGRHDNLEELTQLIDRYQQEFTFINSAQESPTRVWAYVLVNPKQVQSGIIEKIICKLNYGQYHPAVAVLKD